MCSVKIHIWDRCLQVAEHKKPMDLDLSDTATTQQHTAGYSPVGTAAKLKLKTCIYSSYIVSNFSKS